MLLDAALFGECFQLGHSLCQLVVNDSNEICDSFVMFNRVPQAPRFVDLIGIAAAIADAIDVSGFFEV
jgi:hypothetical protein